MRMGLRVIERGSRRNAVLPVVDVIKDENLSRFADIWLLNGRHESVILQRIVRNALGLAPSISEPAGVAP